MKSKNIKYNFKVMNIKELKNHLHQLVEETDNPDVLLQIIKEFLLLKVKHEGIDYDKLLLKYYNEMLQKEIADVIKNKNITKEDFEKLLNN